MAKTSLARQNEEKKKLAELATKNKRANSIPIGARRIFYDVMANFRNKFAKNK